MVTISSYRFFIASGFTVSDNSPFGSRRDESGLKYRYRAIAFYRRTCDTNNSNSCVPMKQTHDSRNKLSLIKHFVAYNCQ